MGQLLFQEMLKKCWSSGEYPFRSSHEHGRVSVPLNSRPVSYYRKGRTTPRLSFSFVRSPASWLVQLLLWAFTVLRMFELLNKLGVGSMGRAIITLTRGMGEQLMYGILARYRVALVEGLVGLFFDGRHSYAGDSFAGHLSLYCGEFLVVSMLVCV